MKKVMLLVLSLLYAQLSVAATIPVASAPGKGVIAAVYPHYHQEAAAYDFNAMPFKPIAKGVSRRFVMGQHGLIVEWKIPAGGVLPLHYHAHEQINFLARGEMLVFSQEKQYHLKPGNLMVFPAFVPHKFVAIKDSMLVGFMTPVREDFLPMLSGVPVGNATHLLEAK
jgi:quercetin dioxygenase-like cupin family protein